MEELFLSDLFQFSPELAGLAGIFIACSFAIHKFALQPAINFLSSQLEAHRQFRINEMKMKLDVERERIQAYQTSFTEVFNRLNALEGAQAKTTESVASLASQLTTLVQTLQEKPHQ